MTKVLVNFIQDRSGSMSTVWQETLSGYKEFINQLREGAKKDSIEYIFNLTTFDTLIDNPVKAVPLDQVTGEELAPHGPRGSTALYDAVGKTLRATEPIQADKYIVVIVTDGQENSSREWTKDALHQAIEDKIKVGNWTFTYLGTQPETWDDATSIGIGVGATASYTPTMAHAAYAAVGQAVHTMSASCHSSSRALMKEHVPATVASSAGMKHHPTKPSATPRRTTPTGNTPQNKKRRWRQQ